MENHFEFLLINIYKSRSFSILMLFLSTRNDKILLFDREGLHKAMEKWNVVQL